MSVDRIVAASNRNPYPSRGAQTSESARKVGEPQRFVIEQVLGEDLFVTGSDGQRLRLAGLGTLGRDLASGDAVLVRVLRDSVGLAFELVGHGTGPARSAMSSEADPASMRFDQAAMRQIAWRAPDAAALASSWRAMVYGAAQEAAGAPAAGALAGYPSAGLSEGSHAPPLSNERWVYPAYAWGGLPILLRIVHADPDGQREQPRRQMPSLAIRIEIELPGGLGRVVLQVQWIVGGVQLVMMAERAGTLDHLRNAVAAISSAFAMAGLRLLRCRLGHGLTGAEQAASAPALPAPASHSPVAPALFRAAAEVLVILMASPANPVSPASR